MSGGVDSAVAAARAVEAGHDVVGVHLALSRMPGTLRTGSRGCCTIEDSMDAQRAAKDSAFLFMYGIFLSDSSKMSWMIFWPNIRRAGRLTLA